MAQWLKKKKKIHLPMQETQEMWSDPWVQKIPWRRKWQPPPVFLPGKSYGQRSLAVYSPWGRKELDTTEQLIHTHTHTHTHTHRVLLFREAHFGKDH